MWWIVLLISLIALVGVLFWGVVAMGIGGKYNSKWSNKLMRYRVIIQAIALLIFVVILSFSSGS